MKNNKLIYIIIVLLIIFAIMLWFMFSPQIKEELFNSTNNNTSYVDFDVSAQYDDEDLVVDYNTSSTINLSEVTSNKVNITKGGKYLIAGTLDNGQIIVDVSDTEKVYLVLKDVTINCSNSSPIYIKNADKTIITIEGNNTLTDGSSYTFATSTDTEPDGTIFSHDDLTINGTGTLNIKANYQDGIVSKDDLIIVGTTINITANDDGIRGKDSLTIKDSNITANTKGDCLKATNDTDSEQGYIVIESGTFNLTANGDGAKGIQAESNITIEKGTFTINSTDDGIHSNNIIVINDGTYKISSGDDGIHSDSKLTINGGNIDIIKSYEGIESANIVINNGIISVVATDDGINGAGGNDTTTATSRHGRTRRR